MITTRQVVAVITTAVALVTAGGRLVAHPGSTTTVTIERGPEARVRVILHMDAQALLAKVEAQSTTLAGAVPVSPAPLAARLTESGALLTAAFGLEAGGTPVPLTLADTQVGDDGVATVTAEGAVPEGRHALTWSCGLVLGAYPVVVRSPHREELIVWLQGTERSVALESRSGVTRRPRAQAGGPRLPAHPAVRLDHILFVLGLFFLCRRLKPLLIQVSAFTAAHSVTLGLSMYGVASSTSTIVEPLIALSVAYVGLENLMTSRLRARRVVMVFAFGCLPRPGIRRRAPRPSRRSRESAPHARVVTSAWS